jgi:hypothetical protein
MAQGPDRFPPAIMFERRMPPPLAEWSPRIIVRTLQDAFEETTGENEVTIKAGA